MATHRPIRNEQDYYTYNSLNSFSFGNAGAGGNGSFVVGGLAPDEKEERNNGRYDVTPRPSIAPAPSSPSRNNPTQSSSGNLSQQPLYAQTLSSRASTHTFGAPSSSSSVSVGGSNYEGDIEFSSSDEEMDGSYYGYYDDREIDVEVSSARYEPSIVGTHEGWDQMVHNSDSAESSWRDREDSVATVRPFGSVDQRSSFTPMPPMPPPPSAPAITTTATSSNPDPAAGFDISELGTWTQSLSQGITGFNLDDMEGVIAQTPAMTTAPAAASSSSRRPSAVRIGIPGWLSGVGAGRRPSTATVTSMNTVNLDSFSLGLKAWANTLDTQERKDWTFVKDKADATPNLSLSPTSTRSTVKASGRLSVPTADELAGPTTRESRRSEWKGMAVNSQEIWGMRHSGRYKVDRRILIPGNAAKAPQQRIDVQSYRDPYFMSDGPQVHEGPVATIHKHSKVAAFSISRSFKLRPLVIVRSPTATIAPGRDSTSTTSTIRPAPGNRVISPTATVSSIAARSRAPGSGGSGKMILLAPKKVQIAFTSTTTTRILMSHGLLDDGRGSSSGSAARRSASVDPERRKKEKEKEMRKERKKLADDLLGTASTSSSKKKKDKEKDKNSSFGSVSSNNSSSSTTSSSLHTYPPPAPPPPPRPAPSASPIPQSQYNSLFNFNHTPGRRRSIAGPYATRSSESSSDPSDDEIEDENGRVRKRRHGLATHAEAFGAIDPTAFEAMAASPYLNPHQQKVGVLKKLLGSRERVGMIGAGGVWKNRELENLMFQPPWMVMASRDKQEEQAKVVETLNASFKDVGLLPSTQRSGMPAGSLPSSATSSVSSISSRKSMPSSGSSRSRTASSASNSNHAKSSSSSRTSAAPPPIPPLPAEDKLDIFEEIPSDCLFMLLPLWPGETDPVTERSCSTPTSISPGTTSQSQSQKILQDEQRKGWERQYLLVYYKKIVTPERVGGRKESVVGLNGGANGSSSTPNQPSQTSSTSSTSSGHQQTHPSQHSQSHPYHPPPRTSSAKTILLTSFTMTARIVKYTELQGSGLRLPEEGLSVVGDVASAWEFRPGRRDEGGGASAGGYSAAAHSYRNNSGGLSVVEEVQRNGTDHDLSSSPSSSSSSSSSPHSSPSQSSPPPSSSQPRECLVDWVIGLCSSRDNGIEFYPNGLARLGLCVEKPWSKEDVGEEREDVVDVLFAGGADASAAGERVTVGGSSSTPSSPISSSSSTGRGRRGSAQTLGRRGSEATSNAFEDERDPQWELTQVGKAVTEMVWLGGIALTSFGGITQ